MSDGPQPVGRESAIPATYRRAPRTERFILTGVLIGAAVGAILGAVLPGSTVGGRGAVALLLGLAGALAGGLVTGAQAALMEYTSGRSADRQRAVIIDDWDGAAFPVPEHSNTADAAPDAADAAPDAPDAPAGASAPAPATDDKDSDDAAR